MGDEHDGNDMQHADDAVPRATDRPDTAVIDGLAERAKRLLASHDSGNPDDKAIATADFAELSADSVAALGPDHPTTLTLRSIDARLQSTAGRHSAAILIRRDVLARRSAVLGADAPETIQTWSLLADVLSNAGDVAAARLAYQEAATRSARMLGPEHADTVAAERALRRLTSDNGLPPCTPELQRVLRIALAITPESLEAGRRRSTGTTELAKAVLFGSCAESRATLALTPYDSLTQLMDAFTAPVRAAAAAIDTAPDPGDSLRPGQWTPDAWQLLGSLSEWMARTGDGTADTSHLVMACLAADTPSMRALVAKTRLTPRDVVRDALDVRVDVGPTDRQYAGPGPILTRQRSARPAPYQRERPERQPSPWRTNPFLTRSQMTTGLGLDGPIGVQVFRWHLATLGGHSLLDLLRLLAIGVAALVATWWALLLFVFGWFKTRAWPAVPVVCADLAITGFVVNRGAPWGLLVLVATTRVVEAVEGRIHLLEDRGEVAEPTLSAPEQRAEMRRQLQSRWSAFLAGGGDS